MSVKQITTLLKSMHPKFKAKSAIKVTVSQYAMMKEVIQDYCKLHDTPRLYGILGRISRRMKKEKGPHFWQTEYLYFANCMMEYLKENDSCRLDDTLANIDEIFLRNNKDSKPGKNRHDDRPQIVSIFG